MATTARAVDGPTPREGSIAADYQDTAASGGTYWKNTQKVRQYLLENVPEFRRLDELRHKV